MTKREDKKLPPLPDEVRLALSELRAERPSPHQQARIRAALEAAEAERNLSRQRVVTKRPARPRHLHPGLWGAMGAALATVLLTVVVDRSDTRGPTQALREAMPMREVSFSITEGGGWVALPWALDRHPEGQAQVHLETPAELDFHQHSSHLPTVQLVSCNGDRCLHQFTANAGDDAEPLRVRIHRPGHYVVHVSHASDAKHIAESFIVRAER